jgi:dCMP deaminase
MFCSDSVWMDAAQDVCSCSHDPHRQVGCVLVTNDGRHIVATNRIPGRLRKNTDRLEKTEKASWIVHAEAAAICSAAKIGYALLGATLYSTRFPCEQCALVIIASGITCIVSPEPEFSHYRWGASFVKSDAKLREAGITTRRPVSMFDVSTMCDVSRIPTGISFQNA